MIVDKNTKQVMLENTEIKRIMSEGGVLWQGYYSWKKYKVKIVKEVIGTFDYYRSDSELLRAYPRYYKVETDTPELGKYRVYGYRKVKGDFIEEVKSKNKKEYPINGEKGDYWYVFKN